MEFKSAGQQQDHMQLFSSGNVTNALPSHPESGIQSEVAYVLLIFAANIKPLPVIPREESDI